MRSVLGCLKIGFDLDGVLNRLDAAVIDWLKEKGHLSPEETLEMNRTWRFEDSFRGLTSEAVAECFASGVPFNVAQPEQGGINVLTALKEAGATIHIVTHRYQYPTIQADTAAWLTKYRVPYDHLVFADSAAKVVYAEAAGLDVFIEDKLETARAMADVVRRSFLYDKRYNQSGAVLHNLRRFYDWSEVRAFFFPIPTR